MIEGIEGKVKDACGCFHTETTEAGKTIEDLEDLERLGISWNCKVMYAYILYIQVVFIYM